jgi:hypothetical protein
MTSRRKSTIVGQFVPHGIKLIESPAWSVLSLSARRVLDRIEIEMCHHGGLCANGELVVTYGDFERFGIHRDAIAPALREVTALGLLVVTEQGRGGNSEFHKASKYRLTYICTKGTGKWPDQPTDDWKRITTLEIAEHIASAARDARTRPSKKQKSTHGKRSVPPPKTMGGNGAFPPMVSMGGTPGDPHPWIPGVPSISPGGGGRALVSADGVVHLKPDPLNTDQPVIEQPLAQPVSDNVVPIGAIGRSRRRVGRQR